jgi:hypothetical protein
VRILGKNGPDFNINMDINLGPEYKTDWNSWSVLISEGKCVWDFNHIAFKLNKTEDGVVLHICDRWFDKPNVQFRSSINPVDYRDLIIKSDGSVHIPLTMGGESRVRIPAKVTLEGGTIITVEQIRKSAKDEGWDWALVFSKANKDDNLRRSTS